MRELCQCDEAGTTPNNAVSAAIELGFTHSFHARLDFEELLSEVSNGSLPIAYLRLQTGIVHAVVVYGITNNIVYFCDPANPDSDSLAASEFVAMWLSTGGMTIIITLASP